MNFINTLKNSYAKKNNIFKRFSKPIDLDNAYYLNKYSISNTSNDYRFDQCKDYIYIDFKNNILIDWEIHVHDILNNNSNVSLDLCIFDNKVAYKIFTDTNLGKKHHVSLRKFLEIKNPQMHYIINELLSFVYNFKNYCFIHNNLSIDNIFIHDNNFHIMEFSKSMFYKNKPSLDYIYYDLLSIYKSIIFYIDDPKIITYLDFQILSYVPQNQIEHQSWKHDIIDLYKNI